MNQTSLLPSRPAIIFDFGGVLMDWNAHYLYDQFFANPAETDQFFDEIGFAAWNVELDRGLPFAQGVRELSRQFPHRAELIRAFDERWHETVRGPIQQSVEIMHRLKARGYPLYGLTNWSAEKFSYTRNKYPIFDALDAIIVSGIVKLVKPDPRMFNFALKVIGRPAGECLLIDDSEKNTQAASQLGFNTIRFTSPEQLNAELTQKGLL